MAAKPMRKSLPNVHHESNRVNSKQGHGRTYCGKQSYPIPIWNGILEHAARIGEALWEFLWMIDKITAEKDGVGIVLGGAPVKLETIAHDLSTHKRTIRRHVEKLEAESYIRRRRTPYGYVFEVLNSRKFGIWNPNKRNAQSGHSDVTREVHKVDTHSKESVHNVPERSTQSGRNKEDAANNAAIKATPTPTATIALPIWIDPPAWHGYLESRKVKPKAGALIDYLSGMRNAGFDVNQELRTAAATCGMLPKPNSKAKPKFPGSDTQQDHINRMLRNAAASGLTPEQALVAIGIKPKPN
jgi:hypothetical protein